MNPRTQSYNLLGVTRSKAKMFEFDIPERYHLELTRNPSELLSLTIGLIGDYGKIKKSELTESVVTNYIKNLVFSAQFFDSYVETRLDDKNSNYFLLIGAASYYLADLQGNARVLSSKIVSSELDLGSEGLEHLLYNILNDSLKSYSASHTQNTFPSNINDFQAQLISFYNSGNNSKQVFKALDYLCQSIYESGTDRQLLFVDVIRAVVKKSIYNSSWMSLQRYTNINKDKWSSTIQNGDFIKEFWPSQKLLGEKGIYKGKSAVIQMPTSAGKTKSLEIIIRSSFYSERTKMAVIVAPFRALCSEIKNSLQDTFKNENIDVDEPSDALQNDFSFIEEFDFVESNLVLVLTPEKFIYIIRNSPELVQKIGLLIYDEGHQFDNGIRGVTYELLLSSLKNMVKEDTQVILISAVINNASAIGDWLIEKDKEIISGVDLLPTHRTVSFANWTTRLGRLQYINRDNANNVDFYVPRVIEQTTFPLRGRERNQRMFPEKNDGKSIALYLALKLVKNGAVAIFCGSKLTVKSISEKVLDITERGFETGKPLISSNIEEVEKLTYLHQKHLGDDHYMTRCSRIGIYSHSGFTSEGLRLAIEYAMQEDKIKFVICTSTLAQGVNLPIKYLMITSFYQADSKIKTRDFHNLIGRAGRAGMHTEGSIIFTDTELFDKRNNNREKWKWENAIDMLDPVNSEPCGSTLLTIFEPLYSDDKNYSVALSPLELVSAYLDSPEAIRKLPKDFAEEHSDSNFSVNGLKKQLDNKLDIIAAIESYLMAYWIDFGLGTDSDKIEKVAMGTLAYSISDNNQKEQLKELFKVLADNISKKVTSDEKRISFGRTLLGVEDILQIEAWTLENIDKLLVSKTDEELFEVLWTILYEKAPVSIKKLTPDNSAFELTNHWLKGYTFNELLASLSENVKYKAGRQRRTVTIEHIIDICHNTYSYGLTLIIGAVSEVIRLMGNTENDNILEKMDLIQKMMKYGLPNKLSISFYELGFADRIVALELARKFDYFSYYRTELKDNLKANKSEVEAFLSLYPSYFTAVNNIICNE
ncbi:DEAD/DEAH box helicase [Sunxiuqinia indica]|uniref:DEAD/DEAH box helicase n=1 Tax=Sunxiuqinia indica TaxID=2692584 RepID=UPI001356EEB9|nr:DEAD/DEAH box helicase [Sunxiuqinia indica]